MYYTVDQYQVSIILSGNPDGIGFHVYDKGAVYLGFAALINTPTSVYTIRSFTKEFFYNVLRKKLWNQVSNIRDRRVNNGKED